MALARLVVVEGPDVGLEFEVPLRGGGIGRGEESAIQLSDLSVSRSHCTLELKDGQLAIVDHGSRNRTLVNGKPVNVHVLAEGDEITVGKTRMAFLPPEGGVVVLRQGVPSRVTIEVGSDELLRATLPGAGADARARRYLASLSDLGDKLRVVADRAEFGRAACEAARTALAADRALLLMRAGGGRLVPRAASVPHGDPEGAQLALTAEVMQKVMAEQKAVALAVTPDGQRGAAAPLGQGPRAEPIGILYADRRDEQEWDRVDLMALSCVAQLVSAGLLGLEVREALVEENRVLLEQVGGGDLVGSSPRTRALLELVGKVGPSDATVLLTGESGSGKEMVSRAIHRASPRARRAFVAVNCAALTETLIESELFGHEKGAFTGATERKIGRFEAADGGTLFLDEIGELPPNCQTKFLRVLEERVFERVGGTRAISVDVRVVAATNRDLAAMVRERSFRDDLFYRLSVIHAVVPPLRERPEDIPQLAEHFLARLAARGSRRVRGFSREAMAALMAHPWPGNVRELRNAVERAVVLGDGDQIRCEDLPPDVLGGGDFSMAPVAHGSTPGLPLAPIQTAPPAAGAARSLRELEREGIVAALTATGGNKAQAAQILEIDRSTLYKKIKDYGIEA